MQTLHTRTIKKPKQITQKIYRWNNIILTAPTTTEITSSANICEMRKFIDTHKLHWSLTQMKMKYIVQIVHSYSQTMQTQTTPKLHKTICITMQLLAYVFAFFLSLSHTLNLQYNIFPFHFSLFLFGRLSHTLWLLIQCRHSTKFSVNGIFIEFSIF